MTTTNHDFTSSGLTSIMVLGSFSSTPLSRRCSIPLYLRHRVGSTSTYKSEGYFIRHVLGMIQDDKGEQCDDPYVSYDAYHIYFDTTLFSTHFCMTCCHVRRPLVWVEAYIFPHFCT